LENETGSNKSAKFFKIDSGKARKTKPAVTNRQNSSKSIPVKLGNETGNNESAKIFKIDSGKAWKTEPAVTNRQKSPKSNLAKPGKLKRIGKILQNRFWQSSEMKPAVMNRQNSSKSILAKLGNETGSNKSAKSFKIDSGKAWKTKPAINSP
jgi:hypothetical protein